MLLKISLLVAALAAAATLAVSQLSLAGKISDQKAELDTTKQNLEQSQTDLAKTKTDAKTAKEAAEKLQKELTETGEKLDVQSALAKTQQQRADRNEADLNKVRGELTESTRELASWRSLTIPAEQVRNRLAELTKANEAITAMNDEKKLMVRKINDLQETVAKYEFGKESPPPNLPAGLKGTVVAVDPKWDFVVLDIGGNQGLVPRGELLVNRDGKLVAKLRVMTVEADRSIANILPEWKQAEVVTGDIVMH